MTKLSKKTAASLYVVCFEDGAEVFGNENATEYPSAESHEKVDADNRKKMNRIAKRNIRNALKKGKVVEEFASVSKKIPSTADSFEALATRRAASVVRKLHGVSAVVKIR